jgi:hypothetical protein
MFNYSKSKTTIAQTRQYGARNDDNQANTTIWLNKRRQFALGKDENLLLRNTTESASTKNDNLLQEKTKIGCKKRRQQASIKNESLLSKRTIYKKDCNVFLPKKDCLIPTKNN